MFLRNYDNIRLSSSMISIPSTGGFNLNGRLAVKGWYGDVTGVYNSTHNFKFAPASSTGSYNDNSVVKTNYDGIDYYKLVVGSDDTPVSYDDYQLKGLISTNDIGFVTSSTADVIYDENDNTVSQTYSKIFVAKNDITIKEIGITGICNNTGGGYKQNSLIYREVLQTPVEVPQGANVVVTFTLKRTLYDNQPVEATVNVQ